MPNLHIRDLPEETVHQLKTRARARGWTLAQLLKALVTLHVLTQARADRGNADLAAVLKTLGLETKQV